VVWTSSLQDYFSTRQALNLPHATGHVPGSHAFDYDRLFLPHTADLCQDVARMNTCSLSTNTPALL
jgi:hypothetical protein